MDTYEELRQLSRELKYVHDSHRRATTILALIVVITCLATVYLARFYINKSVHDAILQEDISKLAEEGFDRVIDNYEIAE